MIVVNNISRPQNVNFINSNGKWRGTIKCYIKRKSSKHFKILFKKKAVEPDALPGEIYKYASNDVLLFLKFIQPVSENLLCSDSTDTFKGSEILDLCTSEDITEKVHTFPMKRFVGVTVRTPNTLERGGFPLSINVSVWCCGYGLHLLRIP